MAWGSSQARRWFLVFSGTSPTSSDFVQLPAVNNRQSGFLLLLLLYWDLDFTDNVHLHSGMSLWKQLYEVNRPRAVFHILQMRSQGREGSGALQKITAHQGQDGGNKSHLLIPVQSAFHSLFPASDRTCVRPYSDTQQACVWGAGCGSQLHCKTLPGHLFRETEGR